jgi:hypothetical protein
MQADRRAPIGVPDLNQWGPLCVVIRGTCVIPSWAEIARASAPSQGEYGSGSSAKPALIAASSEGAGIADSYVPGCRGIGLAQPVTRTNVSLMSRQDLKAANC